MENALERKVAFFERLNALEEEEDGEEESVTAELLGQSRQPDERTPSPPEALKRRRIRATDDNSIRGVKRNLLRTRSLPSTSHPTDSSSAITEVTQRGTTIGKEPASQSSTATSSPARDLSAAPRPKLLKGNMPGKRKKVKSFHVLPESQQIFKGFSFFFLPNDDVCPARRMRILKAMEFGAVWVKEWRPGVTHIVADQHLCYADITKFLRLPIIPESTFVVNQKYPTECIQYRTLFNPRQSHYLLPGAPKAESKQKSSPEPSQESPASLQLKPSREDISRQAMTPLQSQTGLEVQVVPQTVLRSQNKSAVAPNKPSLAPSPEPASNSSKDALDEAIDEAKRLESLPLDSDTDFRDETPPPSSAEDSVTDSDDNKRGTKRTREDSPRLSPLNQSGFSCMHKHESPTSGAPGPNARTIEILQQMADYYSRTNDPWRPFAYRRAISTLRRQTTRITTAEQARGLPHIGQRLALKIEEVVCTDRLRRLENADLDDNERTIQKFLTIFGVGFQQASKWVHQGHRTFDDLVQHAQLTENQKIGIAHCEDFLTRIPRAEVEALGAVVRTAVHELDPDVEVHIMGSYRRGAHSSGDIDLILTKPGDGTAAANLNYLRPFLLESVIPKLFEQGFLKAALAVSSQGDKGSKWLGACALPDPCPPSEPTSANSTSSSTDSNASAVTAAASKPQSSSIWRRIDFLLVPYAELGAAMLYFTGNDIFNRSIRLLASKKGMCLNQRGLWKEVMRGPGRKKVNSGELVEAKDERRIFEVLGVPWREPGERNA